MSMHWNRKGKKMQHFFPRLKHAGELTEWLCNWGKAVQAGSQKSTEVKSYVLYIIYYNIIYWNILWCWQIGRLLFSLLLAHALNTDPLSVSSVQNKLASFLKQCWYLALCNKYWSTLSRPQLQPWEEHWIYNFPLQQYVATEARGCESVTGTLWSTPTQSPWGKRTNWHLYLCFSYFFIHILTFFFFFVVSPFWFYLIWGGRHPCV